MTTINDHFDDETDFSDILEAAEAQAATGWEADFVDDMREKYEQWGDRMFLSDKQLSTLERIAEES